MSNLDARNLVLAVTPFEWPNARLAVAAGRAGAVGVLDLGRDRDRALDALAETARRLSAPFGVRVPAGCPRLMRTLKESPSNRRPKVRRASCERTDCRKQRIPWTVPVALASRRTSN